MNFKLIKRKETWVITWQLWLLIIFSCCCLFFLGIKNIHPFLAMNKPIETNVLVVEGWIADDSYSDIVKEIKSKKYKLIITTGTPLKTGWYLSKYKNYAEISTQTLIKLGIDSSIIVTLPSNDVIKDRTYSSALLVNNWIKQSGRKITSLNIVSKDTHCRRTYYLFKKAFYLDEIKLGIISSEDPTYNSQKWYKSSSGVRTVLDELIAYIYATLFFYPNM